jgi:hypothetical protein
MLFSPCCSRNETNNADQIKFLFSPTESVGQLLKTSGLQAGDQNGGERWVLDYIRIRI